MPVEIYTRHTAESSLEVTEVKEYLVNDCFCLDDDMEERAKRISDF